MDKRFKMDITGITGIMDIMVLRPYLGRRLYILFDVYFEISRSSYDRSQRLSFS